MPKIEGMDYTEQSKMVEALRTRLQYVDNIKHVKKVETHISWVLLAGRYAYKIKKAVNLGFLDFSKLSLRQFYCSEEIRLNRRLAPELYKDVFSIGGNVEHPEFNTKPVLDYAVRMRRFPSSKQMNLLAVKHQLLPQHIDGLAITIAHFHLQLPALNLNSLLATLNGIKLAAEQNFNQVQNLLTDKDELTHLFCLRQQSDRVFNECRAWFEMRRAQGYVRECHGDLHLGNIVLLKQRAVPFDGIEFNPELRWIDVMSDVAFTVMDLQHHQRADLASRLLNGYLEITGDYEGVKLLRFYIAYRAMVRAKVACIRASQEGVRKRDSALAKAECNGYLGLVTNSFSPKRAALIITHGLPGSGKTTLSQKLLEKRGAIRLRSDVERKRFFGLSPLADSGANTGKDIYVRDISQRTYQRLYDLARELLLAGYEVIVDATFLQAADRDYFRQLAVELSVPFVIASLQVRGDVLHKRILQRQEAGNDASEADITVLEKLQQMDEPITPTERKYTVELVNDEAGISESGASWIRLQALIDGSASH
jgi:hypothetical protein